MRSSFADYVVSDLLADVEGVRARAMFGGHGVYKGDLMFAIIVEDELYFKVGDANRKDFVAYKSEPFVYSSKGKKVTMCYWKLPATVMDDREFLLEWTEKAVRAARAKKSSR